MKFLKIALFFLPLGVLFSCTNTDDYAYNEKVTSIFLSEMKQIDETDSVFKDTSKVYAKGFPDSIVLWHKADNLINNSKNDLIDIARLKPTKAAAKFNEGVMQYLTAINDYGKTAKEMLRVKAIDEKRKYYDQLIIKYEKLNSYPDQLLATQKAYLLEVGLQPK